MNVATRSPAGAVPYPCFVPPMVDFGYQQQKTAAYPEMYGYVPYMITMPQQAIYQARIPQQPVQQPDPEPKPVIKKPKPGEQYNYRQFMTPSGNPDKPVRCLICSKTFKTNWTLKKHIRIHTGEKPYSCDSCKQRFTQRGSWQRHLFTNHQDDVEKTLKYQVHRCPHCIKCFKMKENYLKHVMNSHPSMSNTTSTTAKEKKASSPSSPTLSDHSKANSNENRDESMYAAMRALAEAATGLKRETQASK